MTLESATPWGVNGWSTDFSGTNEIGNLAVVPGGSNLQGGAMGFLRQSHGLQDDQGACRHQRRLAERRRRNSLFRGTSNATCLAKQLRWGRWRLLRLLIWVAMPWALLFWCLRPMGAMEPPPPICSAALRTTVDFSVTQVFKVTERLSAQFRAEFFKTFNHPNMSNPYGGPGGSNALTDPSGDAGASFGFHPANPTS